VLWVFLVLRGSNKAIGGEELAVNHHGRPLGKLSCEGGQGVPHSSREGGSMGGHTFDMHGENVAGMRDEGWEAIPQVDGAADAKVCACAMFGVDLGHPPCLAQQLAQTRIILLLASSRPCLFHRA